MESTAPTRFVVVHEQLPAESTLGRFSSAVWLILEKFGFTDFEALEWAQCRSATPCGAPRALLITAPVSRSLTIEDMEWLSRWNGVVFLEGPWSSALDEWFGVSIDRRTPGSASCSVACEDEQLRERLTAFLSGMKGPSNSGAFVDADSLWLTDRSRRPHSMGPRAAATCENTRNSSLDEPSWCITQTSLDVPPAGRAILKWRTRPDQEPSGILLMQKGPVYATTFELFSYLSQDYTADFQHNEYCFSNDRYPFEFILMALLVEGLADAYQGVSGLGGMRALSGLRVSPWPRGKQYLLGVRHDVDRIPPPTAVTELLSLEARIGVSATCYFLPSTSGKNLIRRFEAAGAEIAWHCLDLEPECVARGELSAINAHAEQPATGCSVHGARNGYGWRGRANWDIWRQMGMEYCENLCSMRYFPGRAFKLKEDGGIDIYPFVCMPHHLSLDKNAGSSWLKELGPTIPALARNEMCVIIMNHPDINRNDLSELLERCCPKDFVSMTAREAAQWWRRTHFHENLSFRVEEFGPFHARIVFSAREAVQGLTLEIPTAFPPVRTLLDDLALEEGRLSRFRQSGLSVGGWRLWFDLKAGESRLALYWDRPSEVLNELRSAMCAFFSRDGTQRSLTASEERTLDLNTVRIPARVRSLLAAFAEDFTDERPFAALDIGCGFAGVSLYLAAQHPNWNIVAADRSDRFYRYAQRVAEGAGMRNLRFVDGDILDFSYDAHFDVVIASNVLNYLTSRSDLEKACANLLSVLRKGGRLIIHTPHYWCYREPFTKLIGVQFLPAPAREWAVATWGRRSTMRDIRLPSLGELLGVLKRLGAQSVTYKPDKISKRFRNGHITLWARK